MCRDDAFVSESIPLTRILVQKIEQITGTTTQSLRDIILSDMKQRFTPIWESKQNIAATSLDPRFYRSSLMSKTDWDLIDEHIVNITHEIKHILLERELESMRVYEDQNLEIVGEKQQENTDQCQRDFWGDLARPTREYVDSIDDNTIRILYYKIFKCKTIRSSWRLKVEKLLFLQAMLHSSASRYNTL
uniref:Uncharacterized protein n=1 Tax=Heterorhabditis bacteriophora TaxID=37862 RepID=A0A1I7WA97_HETBA